MTRVHLECGERPRRRKIKREEENPRGSRRYPFFVCVREIVCVFCYSILYLVVVYEYLLGQKIRNYEFLSISLSNFYYKLKIPGKNIQSIL